MFWQGGGKKRLKHQIEKVMEVPLLNLDQHAIGTNDNQLLTIYYQRQTTNLQQTGQPNRDNEKQ